MKILSFKTKVGWITLEEKFNKIERIQFKKKKNFGKSKNLNGLKHQILKFCLGEKKKINTNIQISGTFLQKKIWTQHMPHPYYNTLPNKCQVKITFYQEPYHTFALRLWQCECD